MRCTIDDRHWYASQPLRIRAGEATVVGDTFSDDFPITPGAYSQHLRNNGSTSDTFVTKLSSDGSRLVFSTYFGGSGDDSASAVAIDASGAAWIGGGTTSADLPTLAGFQRWPATPIDPNAGVLDSDLDSIIFGLDANLNRSAFRRELDRIREQVPNDLLHPDRITEKRTDIPIE